MSALLLESETFCRIYLMMGATRECDARARETIALFAQASCNDEAASILNSFKEKSMNNPHAVEVESEQELFGTIDTSESIQLSLSDLDLVAGGSIVCTFG